MYSFFYIYTEYLLILGEACNHSNTHKKSSNIFGGFGELLYLCSI